MIKQRISRGPQVINKENIYRLYWQDQNDVADIAKKLGVSFWTIYSFMNRAGIVRRDRVAASYVSNMSKPQFSIKELLSPSDGMLKIAGTMLYWAEGTLNHNTVDFANSNPEMVKLFLRFLRKICGVKEERLRLYLYAYAGQDLEKLKLYWHEVTNVPLSQFTKPYIRKENLNKSSRKLPNGMVHIRYNDKRLLELIRSWINEYIQWAGTQVAKGDRLSKGSVLSKEGMEKQVNSGKP